MPAGLDIMGFDLGGTLSGALGVVGLVVQIILYVALIGGPFWYFILRPMSYNYKIIRLVKQGGGFFQTEDRAKIKRSKAGEERFKFLKKKGTHYPPPPEAVLLHKHPIAGLQKVAYLYEFETGDYNWCPLIPQVNNAANTIDFQPVPVDNENAAIEAIKEKTQKYDTTNLFLQYMPAFLFLAAMVMVIVLFYLAFQRVDQIAASLGDAAVRIAGEAPPPSGPAPGGF